MYFSTNFPTNAYLKYQIEKANKQLLSEYCSLFVILELEEIGILEHISNLVLEDLLGFAAKDPAAKNSPQYIWSSYSSFHAVRLYRIAHALNTLSLNNQITPFNILARRISERAKILTGIEINPAAQSGRRLVIDHGFGTVIGETTEIGDDCYILQGVVLGARGIAGNKIAKRHPTLGNRVEVGGFVRIFGAVTIGDDVKISPSVVITEDIPANSKVILLTTNLIIKNS